MTPSSKAVERAEKICDQLNRKYKSNYFSHADIAIIAAELKAYAEEARLKEFQDMSLACESHGDNAYQNGFAKGREQGLAEARNVAWCHRCDSRCKDIGLGPNCTMSVSEDIFALRSQQAERGEEKK